jgi:hypothetical protein
MTQATPTISSGESGSGYRTKDNDGKKAILNHHKGSTAPSYAEAGMIWLDDAATPWLLKFYDGADWIIMAAVNATSNWYQAYFGGSAPLTLNYAADTGAANAYAVAPNPPISAYVTGQRVYLKPANALTGAATLAVSGLSTKAIKLANGSDPSSGAMLTGGIYCLIYDGTNFVLTNPTTSSTLLLARGTTVASASTVDLGAADSDYVEISGTATITSLGTTATRNHIWVKFQDILTLTHNATSLILPTGTNITTAAGDTAEFVRISAGNWQCVGYQRANGQSLVPTIGGLGIGQTWTNVTGSRSLSTTYTNSTGLPIFVAFTGVYVDGYTSTFLIDGMVVSREQTSFSFDTARFFMIVPNGSTYQITSTKAMDTWWELR